MEDFQVLILFALSITSFVQASPVELQSVEWKFNRRLYDYREYSSITLDRVNLPPHTIAVNLSLNAFANADTCSLRTVNIYSSQFGIPVVIRDGESFPNNSYTPPTVANITISTNNKTREWVLANLGEGSLFVMAVLPHSNKRIQQQGLYFECKYSLSMRFLISYYAEESLLSIGNEEPRPYEFEGPSRNILSFRIPMDTSSYSLEIEGCANIDSCNVNISLWSSLSPTMWDQPDVICTLNNGSCLLQKKYPLCENYSYLGVNVLSRQNVTLTITLQLNKCVKYQDYHNTSHGLLDTSVEEEDTKVCIVPLSRETPASLAEQGNPSFSDRFVFINKELERPAETISIETSDTTINVLRMHLRTGDTGGSLNIKLKKPKPVSKEHVELVLCASPHRISSGNCTDDDGPSLKIDSLAKTDKEVKVMIPYPQTGTWYISLQSRCFVGKSPSNTTVKCNGTTAANLTVGLALCDGASCGDYGMCKLSVEADLLYSACDCFGGFRGFGCNDGENKESSLGVYLLTLSNLAFIPGIGVALHRRFYIESFVYLCNMVFSTFYHACDASSIYQLCILTYEAHSFSDFFTSLMSFVVTLLAMSRIPLHVRSFLHMFGALLISVAVVYNRHGLGEQLGPIVAGLGILAVSWGYEMYKRRALFPSKRRYIFFIVPGLLLTVIGLSFNLALETHDNYQYVHSLWHIFVASSIVFLLPPAHSQKSIRLVSSEPANLGTAHQALLHSNSQLNSFHSAVDPSTPRAALAGTTPLHYGTSVDDMRGGAGSGRRRKELKDKNHVL